MNIDITAIVIILAFAWVIRSVVDAWSRSRMLRSSFAKDALGSLIAQEEIRRRHATLFWGILSASIAAAFCVIDLLDWRDPTPIVVAVVLGFIAIGNLIYYILVRILK